MIMLEWSGKMDSCIMMSSPEDAGTNVVYFKLNRGFGVLGFWGFGVLGF